MTTYITGPDGLPIEQVDPTQSSPKPSATTTTTNSAPPAPSPTPNGLPLALTDYNPYGTTLHATAHLTNNPFGYAGQYTDPTPA